MVQSLTGIEIKGHIMTGSCSSRRILLILPLLILFVLIPSTVADAH